MYVLLLFHVEDDKKWVHCYEYPIIEWTVKA